MKLITREDQLPEDLHAPNLKLFVCSVDLNLQRKVVEAADTMTTSLGPVSNRITRGHSHSLYGAWVGRVVCS